ncbi:hypothetical protein Glove_413g6 [Diversispora epigaea]|uniref:Uncharacterized protein n=1 Tax=Diversispora epigaea TaxID=1348612 RepID=A0A397GY66_9GLOM|nr:hypothetical protein Glove_413g6 [Diversispora epigaea]
MEITNSDENIFNSSNLLKTGSKDTFINCENENEKSLLAAKQIVLDEELSETDSENSKEQDDFIEIQSLPLEISDLDKIDDKTIEYHKLRLLYQLIRMWQIDKNAVEEVNKQLENLGICYSHFIFDQNKLHKKNLKQKISTECSIFHHCRCLFCGQNLYFYSRGNICLEHSKAINNKNIQVPCIGQYSYSALKTIDPIVMQSSNNYRPRYICCICYEKNGGHLHIKVGGPGKCIKKCDEEGKHKSDVTEILMTLDN